ncbi:MAG: LysE family translocator [Rhodobacteraceae bacterium]|nr:LysE family translocator [Paracoccaceae bacterium]
MSFDLWLAFTAATIILLLIPGPTVLLVMSYAISQGRKVAVACALGVAFGDLIAMSASLFGLGTLIMASATLFNLTKWAGAVYLVWLGIKLLRNPPALVETTTEASDTSRAIFGHAAMVTALNPKSIAFFIAFVPQFIDASAPLSGQFAIVIATFVGLAALNALAYALLADKMRQSIARPSVLRNISRAGGGALILMGLTTATLRKGA